MHENCAENNHSKRIKSDRETEKRRESDRETENTFSTTVDVFVPSKMWKNYT
jgi:hypothetical protein